MLVLAWAASLSTKLSILNKLAMLLGIGAIIALVSKGTNLKL